MPKTKNSVNPVTAKPNNADYIAMMRELADTKLYHKGEIRVVNDFFNKANDQLKGRGIDSLEEQEIRNVFTTALGKLLNSKFGILENRPYPEWFLDGFRKSAIPSLGSGLEDLANQAPKSLKNIIEIAHSVVTNTSPVPMPASYNADDTLETAYFTSRSQREPQLKDTPNLYYRKSIEMRHGLKTNGKQIRAATKAVRGAQQPPETRIPLLPSNALIFDDLYVEFQERMRKKNFTGADIFVDKLIACARRQKDADIAMKIIEYAEQFDEIANHSGKISEINDTKAMAEKRANAQDY